MYGLLWLLSTSGENFMSTAPLEIYLLRKMVKCSILILPAVYIYIYLTDFYSMKKILIFKISYFVFSGRKKLIQVWNNLRASKLFLIFM